NAGNITLTKLPVSDEEEDSVSTPVSYVSGDDGNGKLDVGETWLFSTSYTLTQADLDTKGGGNSKLDNTATADTDQTEPKDASASVDLVYTPALNITKDVTSVTGGTADKAGDVITYKITVSNAGNITLTNLVVTDKVEGSVSTTVSYVSGDDGNGKLDVGETWIFSTSYTLTQADLDTKGGGNSKLDNTATADTDQTEP